MALNGYNLKTFKITFASVKLTGTCYCPDMFSFNYTNTLYF